MLFINLIFYFPIWCTDPVKIVKFQTEYIVDVQQSLKECLCKSGPVDFA